MYGCVLYVLVRFIDEIATNAVYRNINSISKWQIQWGSTTKLKTLNSTFGVIEL